MALDDRDAVNGEGSDAGLAPADMATALAQARAAEHRYSVALRSAGIGVVVSDPAGRVVEVNESLCLLLGRTKEDLLEVDWKGWYMPDELPRIRAARERLASGESLAVEGEVRMLAGDGSAVVARVTASPIVEPDGTVSGYTAQFVDNRAGALLREAESTQRASLDALEQGVCLISFDGKVRLLNRAGQQILGYRPDELEAKFCSGAWVSYAEDGSVLEPEQPLRVTFETGRPVDGAVIGWRTGTGEFKILRVSTQPVLDQAQVASAMVVAFTDITADRAAERAAAEATVALAAAEAELRRTFEQSATPTALMSIDLRFTRVNAAFANLLGLTADDLVGSSYLAIVHPGDRQQTVEHRSGLAGASAGASDVVERRLIRHDGSIIWSRLTITAVSDERTLTHTVVQVEDITEAREAQAALRASEARFAALVERSTDIICVIDGEGVLTYASPAGERVLGFAPGTHLGRSFTTLLHPDDVDAVTATYLDLLEHPGSMRTASARVVDARGQYRHTEIVATNRLHDPAVAGVVANVRDVTDRAEAADRLAWQAFHDALTGLPNRGLLLDRLRQALSHARRTGERTALLFIDLDRFKLVNDSMGHEAGDRLLIEVAARLSSVVREHDTVARLGGDEFVVLAEGIGDPAEATGVARRIIDALGQPIALAHGEVTVSASIGIAYDLDHRAETMLREADTALYRAKENGKNRFVVFDDSLRVEAVRRLATEQLLRRALDDGGIQVHYQPIIDLATGALISAEALLRIPGPDGRLQSPGEFVAIADESGLIVPIGAGVLDDACGQLVRWRAELGLDAPSRVAVNVSARQLAAAGFIDLVQRVLVGNALNPGDLILEFTESTVLEAELGTMRAVEQLHEMGVGLAIDDFGTGYSSLAYLKRFPIDIVKLDQSFVAGLGLDTSDTEIVKAVISLGRALGLVVVAEGIETAEQLEALIALDCDCGQGYLLARPEPADELARQRDSIDAAMRR